MVSHRWIRPTHHVCVLHLSILFLILLNLSVEVPSDLWSINNSIIGQAGDKVLDVLRDPPGHLEAIVEFVERKEICGESCDLRRGSHR
jgi:hypothetical protein